MRYVKDGEAITKYAAIEAVKNENALGTLLAIETGLLTSLNITDIAYIYDKLFSSNFDGASVMSGIRGGVQALMNKKKPGMLFVHCIAHVLELAVLDSIKSDKYLTEFENTLEAIFLMYFYSPKLSRKIKAIAEL